MLIINHVFSCCFIYFKIEFLLNNNLDHVNITDSSDNDSIGKKNFHK